MSTFTVDCATCQVCGLACDDCVIQVILDAAPTQRLTDDERAAVEVLSGEGLLPPLRLLPPVSETAEHSLDDAPAWRLALP